MGASNLLEPWLPSLVKLYRWLTSVWPNLEPVLIGFEISKLTSWISVLVSKYFLFVLVSISSLNC